MLRKRLLARLGVLVLGFVLGAVASIVLLQGVLRDLNTMNDDARAVINGTQNLSLSISTVEAESAAAARGDGEAPARLARELEAMRETHRTLGEHRLFRGAEGEGGALHAEVGGLLDAFEASARGGDGGAAASLELRRKAIELAQAARAFVAREQATLSTDLRALIIGLTIAALVMMNITVVVLLRTASMILRPIDSLVQASRELAQEHFTHKVRTDEADEFAELARAYNRMGDELGANERRKVESLQHLAVTLNHELNNVLNVIDFQLSLLDRRSGGDPGQAKLLREIRENLGRISGTVASLRQVRRVVLTDYMPGEKMLDLPRSLVTDDEAAAATKAGGGG